MQARDRRLHAIAAARDLGDVRLLARVITAFDVPTLWTSREYGSYDREIIDAAEDALHRLPDGADELRVRLLTSLAIELEGDFDDRGVTAADEAVALARALDRPALLAVALNGRYINGYRSAGDRALRRRLARELLDLATEHDLGAYRVLAHLQLQQTAVSELDLAAATAHLADGSRLADQYGLPLLAQIASWYDGLVHVLAARFDEAERAYVKVSENIGRTGIWSSEDGIVGFGAFCLRLVRGRPGELLDRAAWLSRRWSHVAATADIHALALADVGRVAEARAAVAAAGPIRPDYFFDLATAVRAHRAITLDQRDVAEDAYTALLPYEDHFTGGCTTFATIGPVAQVLGDLAVFLGRPAADAAAHYRPRRPHRRCPRRAALVPPRPRGRGGAGKPRRLTDGRSAAEVGGQAAAFAGGCGGVAPPHSDSPDRRPERSGGRRAGGRLCGGCGGAPPTVIRLTDGRSDRSRVVRVDGARRRWGTI
ncbi:hypothetical protein BJF79_34435 [Actinomadura sp. CNU-125]|uniref:hypothetical protein n=1 Tax=Actinomadura sp. CNU-125 TaxID=1904961 RepID=UPI0009663C10|nr:hypothetical protein [Actinomadura sp. CNU-125]OLT33548.1 hypothetical protein BJF79_34435 [Actinomadura sp. CNU-125]